LTLSKFKHKSGIHQNSRTKVEFIKVQE